jgi:hypothetical protein
MISPQPPYTATSGSKELAPTPSLALDTASTHHLLLPVLVASSTLSFPVSWYVSVIDGIVFFTWAAAALSLELGLGT